VPVNSLTEAKTTSATLQEMVKVKEQRHIKAIADLNKVHAAEVKTLSESVSLAKQKITQLIEKQKKDLIEKYVTLTVGHSGLKLNENALTLLKQCVSEAEVDEMLGNMHRALSENALHFKADSLMIDEHIPVDPEVARVVRSVTKAFEGINKK
jgi:Tfp pilus assembly protein PilO